MVKGEDVNDNPQNKGDTVFMCGMILFRVDVGIGKDHATVKTEIAVIGKNHCSRGISWLDFCR